MGLAASQAKLLSITSRLSTLELRSQQISRAKEALAMDTAKISEEYVDAMNKTALAYSTYNDDGEKVYVPLTGAELMTYSPIKNQYALVNASGQVLVSEKDAANYEDSADINEFLQKYGFDPIEETEIRTVVNPDYQLAYDEWEKKHKEWETRKPDPNDPIYWIEQAATVNFDLYDKFLWTTAICYGSALSALAKNLGLPGGDVFDSEGKKVLSYGNGSWSSYNQDGTVQYTEPGMTDCYSHVLSHLLALGSYQTCLGDTINIHDGYGSDGAYAHWWGPEGNNRGGNAAEFAELIDSDKVKYVCCAENGLDITPAIWEAAKNGDANARAQVLMSDYYYDASGNAQIKTLQQKIIDLNYAMVENLLTDQQAWDAINHFVDHDLKNVFTEHKPKFDQEKYDEDYQEWLSEEPEMEDIEPTVEEEIHSFTPPDDAQWYVNLWHRMNGDSQQKDGYTTNQFATTNTLNGLFTNQKRWDILEDGLMNSAEWLKTALETGAIIIERVDYANPSKLGSGIKKYDWVATPYKNALDIVEQTDDKAVAKAQAEYERKQRVLEDKDKQYDSVLKLIDTEHSALQTEYESAKAVVQKNTERTLKIYSA